MGLILYAGSLCVLAMGRTDDLEQERGFGQQATRWISRGLVVCALLLSLLPSRPVRAQEGSARYFEETGQVIAGPFLVFFEQHGGLATFGYPLTKVFPEDGHDVQYFQRARFELHHPGGPDERIVLGALGTALHPGQPPIPASEIPPPDHAERFYFAETGHTVGFAFLRFYQQHGGVDVLGYPITEWIIEPNGRIVQYLERGKLEWYPENPLDKRVQLGMLGTIWVAQHVDARQTEPSDEGIQLRDAPTPTPQPPERSDVARLRVNLTLHEPMVGSNVEQTAYVYVADENNWDVAGAFVEVEIQYPNGEREELEFPSTNAAGVSWRTFAMRSFLPGQIVSVHATVRYGDQQAETSAVCLLWW